MIILKQEGIEEAIPSQPERSITTFQHTCLESDGVNRDIKLTVENMVSIDEYLEAFGDFLRGIGFRFNGELEIVDDELTEEYLGKNPYGAMEDTKDE